MLARCAGSRPGDRLLRALTAGSDRDVPSKLREEVSLDDSAEVRLCLPHAYRAAEVVHASGEARRSPAPSVGPKGVRNPRAWPGGGRAKGLPMLSEQTRQPLSGPLETHAGPVSRETKGRNEHI